MLSDESPAVADELAGLNLNHPMQSSAASLQHNPFAIDSPGVVAVDITAKFAAAASALDPGQVVKDGFFTLFESVSALEIMDPKMDSGCPGAVDALEETYDLQRDISPQEVIGIMDQLLCHEMAWHLGYPLSQTILTSLYVEALIEPPPTSIEQADFVGRDKPQTERTPMQSVLRAYCLGMLKACSYVNERIKREHYYEEEDFVTNTFHRSLLEQIDVNAIREVIQDARQLVHSMSFSISKEIAEALGFRLELRYAFLRAIELTEYRKNPGSMKTPWIEMRTIFSHIYDSHKLGKPVPDSFSAKLQSKLTSTMPPRPIVMLSFEDASSHLKRLLDDGLEVINVLNYSDTQSLMTFVMTFQAKKPQPLVFIRTLLQSYLFKDMILLGDKSMRQLLDEDFALITLPASILLDRANDLVEAPHDPRFAIATQMEQFRARAGQSYLDIFRTFCQNRSRVRRTLCHTVQDWEVLQSEAEEADRLLQVQIDEVPLIERMPNPVPTYSLPLSSWAYFYKLKQLEWIVQLGFELDIYQQDELAGMYWYLHHVAKSRVQHVDRIKSFTMHKLNLFRSSQQQTQRQSPQRAAKEAEFSRSLSFLQSSGLEAAATCELADALYCLHLALNRLGLVKSPPRPYSTDRLRYELRMRPFLPVAPEMPGLAEYTEECLEPKIEPQDLLKRATAAVGSARKLFDVMRKLSDEDAFCVGSHDRWAERLKACLMSCIQAHVSISVLNRAMEEQAAQGSSMPKVQVVVPASGSCHHDWWIVPKITAI